MRRLLQDPERKNSRRTSSTENLSWWLSGKAQRTNDISSNGKCQSVSKFLSGYHGEGEGWVVEKRFSLSHAMAVSLIKWLEWSIHCPRKPDKGRRLVAESPGKGREPLRTEAISRRGGGRKPL